MEAFRAQLFLFLLLLVKAREDSSTDQRKAVFDPSKDSSLLLQRPLDFFEIMGQTLLDNIDPLPGKQTGLTGPPVVASQPAPPDIPFPLARPTLSNIYAICQYSNRRPRYPKNTLPRNGYGYLHRQASSVNKLESWFTMCCGNGTQEDLTLCCAQQAWEQALSAYCEDESMIKTVQPKCCLQHETAKYDCFEKKAPDQSYQPSGQSSWTTLPFTYQGFHFDRSICQTKSISQTAFEPLLEKENRTQSIGVPLEADMGLQRVVVPDIPTIVREKDSSTDQRKAVFDPSKDSSHLLQRPLDIFEIMGQTWWDNIDPLPGKQTGLTGPPVVASRPAPPSIPFPLARPTPSNIYAICQYSNRRPRYPKKTLPRNGYGYLHRQASSVNKLESWFTTCCGNGTQEDLTLCCAQQAWEQALSAYCEDESMIKTVQPKCCLQHETAKYDCFEKKAPDQSYQPSGQSSWTTLPFTYQGFHFDRSICQTKSISQTAFEPLLEKENRTQSIGVPLEADMGLQRVVVPDIPTIVREKDSSTGQRKAVFDPSKDSSHLLQRPLDIFEIMGQTWWDNIDPLPGKQTGLTGPPVVASRPAPPSIPFPLARPTLSNIYAICQYSNRRPRYPKKTLPRNGYGYLHRQASSVNKLESWFTTCCGNGTQEDLTLCCAQQAWEKSISAFCGEEFRVKTSHYYCCLRRDHARHACFEREAPNKSYQPSGIESWTTFSSSVQDFDFNPSVCNISTSEFPPRPLRVHVSGTLNISFPLGRPNSLNMASICLNHKRRPRYLSKCLPQTGFKWLARQSKAINSLEKGFLHCCKENIGLQACLERKWKKMVIHFCKADQMDKKKQFHCCNLEEEEKQYDCFASAAPNPNYILNVTSHAEEHPTLNMLCDKTMSLQRMKLPFTVNNMVKQCCTLLDEMRPACMHKMLDQVCKADDLSSVNLNCCKANIKRPTECLSKLILRRIAKAKRISHKIKICPLTF